MTSTPHGSPRSSADNSASHGASDRNAVAPVKLPANQPPQFYRGGAAIAELRGLNGSTQDFGPEDWVGSTTTLFGQSENGLTRLPDGQWLRDAVKVDPLSWFGPDHLAELGDSSGLLVKLLDAGQRLPVHFHPSNSFAAQNFSSHFGKTEAWIVVSTYGDDPRVYAGFRENQDAQTIAEWVANQDASAMLGALNSFPVAPGDTVYIPAGLPHAIGEGVFVVELQQPTDFSLTMEWQDFLDSPEKGHLGLGYETALKALDLSGWDSARLSTIVRHTADQTETRVNLLGEDADSFFQAERLQPSPEISLAPSFGLLVVLTGTGTLQTAQGIKLSLTRGDTVLVPYSTGESIVEGELTAIYCRPPQRTS